MIFKNKKAEKEDKLLNAVKKIADAEKNVGLNTDFLDKVNREFTDKAEDAVDSFLKSTDKTLDTDELGDAVSSEVEYLANEMSDIVVLREYEMDVKEVEERLKYDEPHAPGIEILPGSDKAKVFYPGQQNLPSMSTLVQMALNSVGSRFNLHDATVLSVECGKGNEKDNKHGRPYKVTFSYTDSDGKHTDCFFVDAPQRWKEKDFEYSKNTRKEYIDNTEESMYL